MKWKTKPKRICGARGGEKKQKVSDACCALYITALVAGVLELETNILHVLDLMVRCICIAIMVAIPLFPILFMRTISPNWSNRLPNCWLPPPSYILHMRAWNDRRRGVACGIQDRIGDRSSLIWFHTIVSACYHHILSYDVVHTTPRQSIGYHVGVSNWEMRRIHVDGGELECRNFSTWKKAISISHEVNHQSTIIQDLIGEFIARAHRDRKYFLYGT
jgi:hypothetical protein